MAHAVVDTCSILLLKEASSKPDTIPGQSAVKSSLVAGGGSGTSSDADQPYSAALHSAFRAIDSQCSVEYLAPMTTVYPDDTLLSRAIASGPPVHCRPLPGSAEVPNEAGKVWAFAVTSQNAVRAVREALSNQLDPEIRDAWLQIPIYCLTGATLASVKQVGFKTINSRHPFGNPSPEGAAAEPMEEPSFDNGDQLVDFLLSLDWPKAAAVEDKDFEPTLWFLTGETHMKTLAEKLSAHRKPFLEVVVYKTGPRPGFDEELAAWLARTLKGTSAGANGEVQRTDTLWLAGFSPRGVDLSIPALWEFLEESGRSALDMDGSPLCKTSAKATVKWAAIGTTTAKRIGVHLSQLPSTTAGSARRIDVGSEVAVAKAPNPVALAEAIVKGTLCQKVPQ
ncbi:unnamed protein product [Mortierella alpina]